MSGGAASDRATQERLTSLKQRLTEGLANVDPYHRLRDRPLRYELTAGQTLEITFRDVPAIGEAEIVGVKRLLGGRSFCTVSPQSRERLIVRFVVPLA